MSVLKKSTDGLLYFEDFSDPNSLMWTLSPSYMPQVLEFGAKGPVATETGLTIRHSEKYVTYTMVEPDDREEYGAIFSIHHVPVALSDIGGVIVLGNTNQYVECQTYMATGPSEIINSDNFLVDLQGMVTQGIEEKLGNRQLSDIVNEMVENSLRENGYIIDASGEGASGFPDNPPPIPGFDDPEIPDSDDPEVSDPDSETQEPSDEPSDGNPYGDQEVVEGFVDTIYKYIKVYKIKHKYYFYASPDMFDWIEVGNVSMETSAGIGLFLYGTNDQSVLTSGRFKCDNMAIYTSRFFYIYGIDSRKDFEILSNNKIIFRSDSSKYLHMRSRDNRNTVINTTELPMPIKDAVIRIYPKREYANTISQFNLGDIWGGDEFHFKVNLKVFVEDYEHEIVNAEYFDLGAFYSGNSYVKFIIHNYDTDPAENVKISIKRYSTYYSGDDMVYVGIFDEDHPISAISFHKEITIPVIHPSEGVIIYAKLADSPTQDYFMKANDFRFKMIMEY